MNTTGYAPINGLKLYYETCGVGQPLVLVHGGFGVVGMFRGLLEELASIITRFLDEPMPAAA